MEKLSYSEQHKILNGVTVNDIRDIKINNVKKAIKDAIVSQKKFISDIREIEVFCYFNESDVDISYYCIDLNITTTWNYEFNLTILDHESQQNNDFEKKLNKKYEDIVNSLRKTYKHVIKNSDGVCHW